MADCRLLSWNVNGVRAVVKKGFLEWLCRESPDVLCIQETKARPEQLGEELKQPRGYRAYWNYPEKGGYGGVATFTREAPRSVAYDLDAPGLDTEGRVLIAVYPAFTLLNVYFPNGKREGRLKYKLDFYDAFLNHAQALRSQGHRLVICGDVNTAHREIDLARPRENQKVSGFLPEERAWIDKFLAHGYVDTFRHFHPETRQYTWWDMKTGARARNVGWRLDYFFVSEELLPALRQAFALPEVTGSDHCPVGVVLAAH